MEPNKYNPENLSSVKYCYDCKENKVLTEFNISKNGQFGRYPICKLCRSTIRKLANFEAVTIGLKVCAKCKEEKEVKDFDKDKSKLDGLQIYCRMCRRNSTKVWASSLEGFIKKILADLNILCKKKNICNDLTLETVKQLYNEQNGLCALTGIPLTHIAYSKLDNNEISEYFNISIDRIDYLGDFSINNVQLIGSMIKRMKGDMGNSKFIEYCKMIVY